jgi:hypothetical protein
LRQAALSCCFASASARTLRSARTTRARLMVTWRSRATRRDYPEQTAARVAGMVTLWRTDLAGGALRFVGIIIRISRLHQGGAHGWRDRWWSASWDKTGLLLSRSFR